MCILLLSYSYNSGGIDVRRNLLQPARRAVNVHKNIALNQFFSDYRPIIKVKCDTYAKDCKLTIYFSLCFAMFTISETVWNAQ